MTVVGAGPVCVITVEEESGRNYGERRSTTVYWTKEPFEELWSDTRTPDRWLCITNPVNGLRTQIRVDRIISIREVNPKREDGQ